MSSPADATRLHGTALPLHVASRGPGASRADPPVVGGAAAPRATRRRPPRLAVLRPLQQARLADSLPRAGRSGLGRWTGARGGRRDARATARARCILIPRVRDLRARVRALR